MDGTHQSHARHDAHDHHLTPFQRLRHMLWLDGGDYLIIVVYIVLIGLLALAVPLTAQALVNTIAKVIIHAAAFFTQRLPDRA